jgi:GxxExxY protein
MPTVYRVDFVCFETVLVELKALSSIGPVEHSQLINYLKAAKLQRGLLLNFGARSFRFKRVICGLVDDPLQR